MLGLRGFGVLRMTYKKIYLSPRPTNIYLSTSPPSFHSPASASLQLRSSTEPLYNPTKMSEMRLEIFDKTLKRIKARGALTQEHIKQLQESRDTYQASVNRRFSTHQDEVHLAALEAKINRCKSALVKMLPEAYESEWIKWYLEYTLVYKKNSFPGLPEEVISNIIGQIATKPVARELEEQVRAEVTAAWAEAGGKPETHSSTS
jgi:transcription-repair coupling factor (superfamily II helicase)